MYAESTLSSRKTNNAQLAEKVNLLLNDAELRQKLGEQGRVDVLERFDWEVIDRRYTDFICSFINLLPDCLFTACLLGDSFERFYFWHR